jgi:hypothetical protein
MPTAGGISSGKSTPFKVVRLSPPVESLPRQQRGVALRPGWVLAAAGRLTNIYLFFAPLLVA